MPCCMTEKPHCSPGILLCEDREQNKMIQLHCVLDHITISGMSGYAHALNIQVDCK